MRRIHYSGASFATTDDVAHEVGGYARELAHIGAADVVEVPGIDATGECAPYDLLLGPASQLAIGPNPDVPAEIDDAAAVEELRRRRAALDRRGVAGPASGSLSFIDEF